MSQFIDVVRQFGMNVAPTKSEEDYGDYLRVVGSSMGGMTLQPRPDNFSDQLHVQRISALVYRCAQLWAESILQAPLNVFRVRDRKVIEEITTGEIWDVLTEINGHIAYHEWMYVNILNLALTGNSYTWKVRNNRGDVVELWPFRPDEVEIAFDPVFDAKGKFRYEWRPISGGGISGKGGPYVFKSTSILHLRIPSPISSVYGTGPVRASHDEILADQKAKRSTLSWLDGDGVPAGVLQTDQVLTDDMADVIKKRWRAAHASPDKRGNIAILGAGTKFVPIAVSPKDIEWLNQRKLSRAGVLMSFGVPPIYAGMEGENFANRKEQRLLFWQDTIRPKLRLIEAQMTEFFARDFDPEYVIKFDESRVDAFVEALVSRVSAAVSAANPVSRVMRPYEVRSRFLGIEERFEGDDEFKEMPGQGGGPFGGGFGGGGDAGQSEAGGGTPKTPGTAAAGPKEINVTDAKAMRRLQKFEKFDLRKRRVETIFMQSMGKAFKHLHSRVLKRLLEGRSLDDVITEKDVAKILPNREQLEQQLFDASSHALALAFREGVEEAVEDTHDAYQRRQASQTD